MTQETHELTPNMRKFFDRIINLKHYVEGAYDMTDDDRFTEVLKTIYDELDELVKEEDSNA